MKFILTVEFKDSLSSYLEFSTYQEARSAFNKSIKLSTVKSCSISSKRI